MKLCWLEILLFIYVDTFNPLLYIYLSLVQFSSVAQSCLTLCDPIDCRMPGFPVLPQFPELAQTYIYLVGDAIQPFHPLSSPFPPGFNLSQNEGLFLGVSSSHVYLDFL